MAKLNRRKKTVIPESSIILDLKPMLAARNIKSPHAFLTKIGIQSHAAQKMLHGESIQINHSQLTILCLHLNCTPNDLFALRNLTPPEDHTLNGLRKFNPENAHKIEAWLSSKSIQEIEEMMKG